MNKLMSIAILVISSLIIGCEPDNEPVYNVDGHKSRVVVIDGCEYLYSGTGYSFSMTHKGNCTNKIHYLR